MRFIHTRDSSGVEISLSYTDYGEGKPVVLIHGWPLAKEMWEYQETALVNAGLRVIKYDRRGFGESSRPWEGYDYDMLSDDLHAVIEQLDLDDVTLVGFSMGGGEVVRYLSRHDSSRVAAIVLIGSVTPYLARNTENVDGVDEKIFDEMMERLEKDRIDFLSDHGKWFFGVSLISHPVSTTVLEYFLAMGAKASPRATQQCALSFAATDFRADVAKVKVPTLIIHGGGDKTVPIEASSDRTAKLIPDSHYSVYDGAPHGLFYTHKDQLNRELIQFIGPPTVHSALSLGQQVRKM